VSVQTSTEEARTRKGLKNVSIQTCAEDAKKYNHDQVEHVGVQTFAESTVELDLHRPNICTGTKTENNHYIKVINTNPDYKKKHKCIKKWLKDSERLDGTVDRSMLGVIWLSNGIRLFEPAHCVRCKATLYDYFLPAALEFVINCRNSPEQKVASMKRLIGATTFILESLYSCITEH